MASQQSETGASPQPKGGGEEVHTKYCLASEGKYTDRKNSSTSEETLQFVWLLKQRTGAAYILT